MNYSHETMYWRKRHLEAGQRLKEARDAFFGSTLNCREMVRRLRTNHTQELREIAREIRSKGLYAPCTPLCQVEVMLMKRLWRAHMPDLSWSAFVRTTVGFGWTQPHLGRSAA